MRALERRILESFQGHDGHDGHDGARGESVRS
jgi:hypothetical protein